MTFAQPRPLNCLGRLLRNYEIPLKVRNSVKIRNPLCILRNPLDIVLWAQYGVIKQVDLIHFVFILCKISQYTQGDFVVFTRLFRMLAGISQLDGYFVVSQHPFPGQYGGVNTQHRRIIASCFACNFSERTREMLPSAQFTHYQMHNNMTASNDTNKHLFIFNSVIFVCKQPSDSGDPAHPRVKHKRSRSDQATDCDVLDADEL